MGTSRFITVTMRVVFDTNTVLSALVFGKGQLSWLREIWREKQITPMVSASTASEIGRVLSYPKFKLSKAEQTALLNDYLPFCEQVEVPDSPPEAPECRDINDMPFLWLAIAGKADYIVSGDKDLLVLADVFAILIVTVTAFKEVINSNQ